MFCLFWKVFFIVIVFWWFFCDLLVLGDIWFGFNGKFFFLGDLVDIFFCSLLLGFDVKFSLGIWNFFVVVGWIVLFKNFKSCL